MRIEALGNSSNIDWVGLYEVLCGRIVACSSKLRSLADMSTVLSWGEEAHDGAIFGTSVPCKSGGVVKAQVRDSEQASPGFVRSGRARVQNILALTGNAGIVEQGLESCLPAELDDTHVLPSKSTFRQYISYLVEGKLSMVVEQLYSERCMMSRDMARERFS